MVRLTGSGFVDGQTVIGFGSSDIAIRRLWVTDSNHIVANVSISPVANQGATEFTVVSGLQVYESAIRFPGSAGHSRQVSMIPPITNATTGTPGVPSGGIAIMTVSNLNAAGPSAISMTVNDQRATVLTASNGQVTFVVPGGSPLGPAVVKMQLLTGDPCFRW